MDDRISALMDGELSGDEAHELLGDAKRRDRLRERWQLYHAVGDLMRGTPPLSGNFHARVSARLADEPTVLASHRTDPPRRASGAWPVAASLAAVLVGAWLMFDPTDDKSGAVMRLQPVEASGLASQPSDESVNAYLVAHQEFSPGAATRGVRPYIRTVTHEGGQGGQ